MLKLFIVLKLPTVTLLKRRMPNQCRRSSDNAPRAVMAQSLQCRRMSTPRRLSQAVSASR
jgi:hypothetical protein